MYSISSSGVSSMAYTLGVELQKQGKRVIVVDFDLYTPKLDTYFNVVPFNKELGYKTTLENTALNDLRIKGSVININKLITKTKLGIDYLSGIYVNTLDGIDRIDYSKLLNQLGVLYDYIVIDNGKIINSIQCSLVQSISKAAYKNIILVDNSKVTDLNLTVLKMGVLKNLANNIYILNNSTTTIVTDKMKSITKDKYYLFLRDKSTGSKVYTNNKVVLDSIIGEVL